jgi:hypothetical protein
MDITVGTFLYRGWCNAIQHLSLIVLVVLFVLVLVSKIQPKFPAGMIKCCIYQAKASMWTFQSVPPVLGLVVEFTLGDFRNLGR